MSNIIEICTNNEPTRVRDVLVGKQKVQLRRSRTTITSDNAAILAFWELMNALDPALLDNEQKTILTSYIADCQIRRKDITTYAPFFPDKAMRILIESEVIYRVAQ